MAGGKTPFHAACGRFVDSLNGSRKIFSNLTDVFSAIAYRDFSNDWAPDYAERCFKFNKAQKKFQHDFRAWADSITEQDIDLVRSMFGIGKGDGGSKQQGGDQHRYRSPKASVSYARNKVAKKSAQSKGKTPRRQTK